MALAHAPKERNNNLSVQNPGTPNDRGASKSECQCYKKHLLDFVLSKAVGGMCHQSVQQLPCTNIRTADRKGGKVAISRRYEGDSIAIRAMSRKSQCEGKRETEAEAGGENRARREGGGQRRCRGEGGKEQKQKSSGRRGQVEPPHELRIKNPPRAWPPHPSRAASYSALYTFLLCRRLYTIPTVIYYIAIPPHRWC